MTSTLFSKTCWVNRIFQQRSYKAIKTQTCQILSRNIVQQKKKDEESTINEYHANKFTNELKEWWEPNGPIKTLHAMQQVRVPFIRDALLQDAPCKRTILPLENKTILDVGCGGGLLSESLARLGANVTGIDANKNLVELAQIHADQNDKLPVKPSYYHTTIEEHSAEFPEYYDGVVASEVIEHVNNKELFVKSCVAALKPGGRIIFTTPNRTRLTQVLGIWVAEYVINMIPRGTHEYHMMITPQELTFLLEKKEEKLRYVSVKPTASISALRQKIWHLLDLPDYCEEIIILKSGDQELPLTELRVGNDPQHPFLLEVWLPESLSEITYHNNMLTMGESDHTLADGMSTKNSVTGQDHQERITSYIESPMAKPAMVSSNDKGSLRSAAAEKRNNFLYSDFKKSDLASRVSSTSVFKLYKNKNRDSFTNILLKIQSDLSTLSNKLSNLENRIPPS